jgi:hypothetical protein
LEVFVNLVGTRATRGEHEALRRWYADHVHQLLRCPGLLAATLHRRDDGAAVSGGSTAPEVLCLYDFVSAEAFADYEASALYREVQADRDAGWGRDGITITMRSQFKRLYRCRAAAAGDHGALWSVNAVAGPISVVRERELAAGLCARGAAQYSLLRAAVEPPPIAAHLLIEAAPAPLPHWPGALWSAVYRSTFEWRR